VEFAENAEKIKVKVFDLKSNNIGFLRLLRALGGEIFFILILSDWITAA